MKQCRCYYTMDDSTGTAQIKAYRAIAEVLLRCTAEGCFRDVTLVVGHPSCQSEMITSLSREEAQERLSEAFKGLCHE